MTQGIEVATEGDGSFDEDWKVVERLLPPQWEAKARELGALRRGRQIADAATLLRVMLIHLAHGCGLRETAVRAQRGGLAKVSDVAILKRLRSCGAWFEWMANGLRQQWLPAFPVGAAWAGRKIRLIDGTMVSEPGDTGSQWRLHYSIGLPALNCEEVIVTTPREGETLKRFAVHKGEILIGDRGYAHAGGIAHVVAAKADVIIRINLVTLPLYGTDAHRWPVLRHVQSLGVGQCGDWPVRIKSDQRWIAGRLCAVRKSVAATRKARARVTRESQRGGHRTQPATLAAAEYVLVFTTLPADCPSSTVMELYRGRWQIELAFKRLKSLVQLGHLKKHDEIAARAWLQGKLLVAFLADALLVTAERISPWGYPLAQGAPQPVSMAGDRVHA
jgi:hypothetical protein